MEVAVIKCLFPMTTHSDQSLLKDLPEYTNCPGGMTLWSRKNKFLKGIQ
ncbi:rCG56582 [Rattus norvegicus]|uniref:RCG56582 n=1 Tax=Rattus norvegicus TaxID=10116 RepID=A6KEQ8_RAT|nr:rCG56582 [Rattus norvegicus]